VTILVITGYVRDKFMDPDEYWEMHNVAGSVVYDESSDLDWEDMLPLHFVDGLYPLFPNAAYPILGLAIGKLIHGQQAAIKSNYLNKISLAGGITIVCGVMLTLVGKLAPSWINESDLYGVYIGKWRPWPYETLELSLVSIG